MGTLRDEAIEKAAEARRHVEVKERPAFVEGGEDAVERHPIDIAVEITESMLDAAVSNAPEPLKKLGEYLAGLLDEDQWKAVEPYLNAAALHPKPSALIADGGEDDVERTDWFKGECDAEGNIMPDDPLFLRACEVVRHAPDCSGRAKSDRHCDCGAVTFLDDLAVALTKPEPVADGGEDAVELLAERFCDDSDARIIAEQTDAPQFKHSATDVREYWRVIARAAIATLTKPEPAPRDDVRRKALEAVKNSATVGKKGSCVTRSKWVTIPVAVYHQVCAALIASPDVDGGP